MQSQARRYGILSFGHFILAFGNLYFASSTYARNHYSKMDAFILTFCFRLNHKSDTMAHVRCFISNLGKDWSPNDSDFNLEKTSFCNEFNYQVEICQGFCSSWIHRWGSFLPLPSRTQVTSPDSYVEVWPVSGFHFWIARRPDLNSLTTSWQLLLAHQAAYPWTNKWKVL